MQQDVLLPQLELSKLLDTEIVLTGAIATTKAQLNALLDLPANHAISLPKKVFVVDSIPLLASGKTNYPEVAKVAEKLLNN